MNRLPAWLFLALAIIWSQQAAAVPDGVAYQGYLTDNTGAPLSSEVQIAFDLYDVPTGGVSLWSGVEIVTPDNGLFTVQLGDDTNPLPPAIFREPVWLGITVESDDQMTPRRPLLGVASAFHAQSADSVAPGAVCSPGDFINCYSGPPDTLNVGLCQSGTRTCELDTGFGACENEVTPAAEVCFDGFDNNCDGDVDENCNCVLYRDQDGDSFGDPNNFINDCDGEPGYVSNNQDCYDQNLNARPGQPAFFPVNRGDGSFDYNCDGQQTRQDIVVGSCPSSPPCNPSPGWFSFVPNCGQSGPRLGGCDQVFFDCEAQPGSSQVQSCR